MRICVCGGGNLGHVVAGFMAARGRCEVSILTRRPERWSHELQIETPDRGTLAAPLACVSSQPAEALDGAGVVLLCLPGFSIREVLLQIRDFLPPQTAVGTVVSSTGFFFESMSLLPPTTPLFGFQRVPFISRVVDYGRRARLLGYKDSLRLAVEHCPHPEALRLLLQELLATPVSLLGSSYEASLSNSNPLLHPARLYSLWKDWRPGVCYDRIPLFYEEWTEEAAELYIAMDAELQALLRLLPVTPGSIPPVLDYYESSDAPTLAQKLRSIEAFKGIPSPMRHVPGGYVPDFQSRYFTEDFPYGLAIVSKLAHDKNSPAPTIDRLCQWGLSCLGSYSQ